MKMLLTVAVAMFSVLNAFDATIPVLHFPDFYQEQTRGEFLSQLEKAVSEVGFFALTGTGVDPSILDQAYDQAKCFFAKGFEEKMALFSRDGQYGYVPGESAKGETRIDCKEFFHVGRTQNIWPEEAEFKVALQDLYQVLDTCKDAIGETFSHLVGRDVNAMTREGSCLMRSIHYPANPPEGSIWAGAHTDIDFFTILPRSTARGLQVLNQKGEWVDVVVPDGAFVINCGDMLENLTNGFFRSAFHRVVDPGLGEERFSLVFFVHPRSSDRLDPLPQFIEKTGGRRRYAKVSAHELLAERLIDLGLASHELMQSFVDSGAIEKLREMQRFSSKAEDALIQAGFRL